MIGRVLHTAAFAALLAVAAGWFVFLRPASMGGSATWIIVRGDSMLPTYQTGDLIVFSAAPSYGVGDVVAYRVPAGQIGAGRVVMHRIVGGDEHGFLLQGDNNPAPDPWQPAAGDVVGAVWLVGPQLGRPIALLHQPAVAAALAAAVMVAVVLSRRPAPPDPHRSRGGTKVPLPTGRRSRVRVGTQPV
jgi:signal peptidase